MQDHSNRIETTDREIDELATQYRLAGFPHGNTPSGFARYVMDRVRRENNAQKDALERRIAARESDPRIQRAR